MTAREAKSIMEAVEKMGGILEVKSCGIRKEFSEAWKFLIFKQIKKQLNENQRYEKLLQETFEEMESRNADCNFGEA